MTRQTKARNGRNAKGQRCCDFMSEWMTKIWVQAFEERNHQLRRVGIMRNKNKQRNSHDQANQHLKVNFLFCRKPKVSLLRDFRVVVDETDGCKADQSKERE